MKPVLFEIGPLSVHSYGLFIAIGMLLATWYLIKASNKAFNLSADKVNQLVMLIFVAAFVGGKLFLAFESKGGFKITDFISGNGFVFYGSFIMAVPIMLLFFKKNRIPTLPMLDIMALVTCIVHSFGRIGCFMAGCCYGKPTGTNWGVTFSATQSSAEPLHTLLHPTQLYEAFYIAFVGLIILLIRKYYLRFHGQLFLTYLLLYAIGRSILETYRGDYARGFAFGNISNAQLVAGLIAVGSIGIYCWLYFQKKLLPLKNQKS